VIGLRTRALNAAVWYGGTRIVSQGLSWVVTVQLARLLTPADYGVFAMAVGALLFLDLFQELGLGTAVIQRRDLSALQVNAVFWVLTATSVIVCAAAFAGAPVVAAIYAEPRLAGLVRMLSLTFLLNSLRVIPYGLLTKTLDLKGRSFGELCGTVVAGIVALVAAHAGLGVYALVLGHLARTAVFNTVLLWLCPWRPGLTASFQGLRSVFLFGGQMTASSFVSAVSPMFNNMLIARLLGGYALGFFTMADSIATMPHRISTALMNQISLPVFSENQDDRRTLQEHFLKISKYLAVVAIPVHIGLALTAPEFVVLVLSDKWAAIVRPVQIMAIASAITGATVTASALLSACGRADMLFRAVVFIDLALAVSIVAGAPGGVTGLAIALLVVTIVTRGYLFNLGLRELSIPIARYLRTITGPLKAVVAMAVAMALVRLGNQGLALPVGLVLDIAVGAVVYAGVLFLSDRAFYLEFRGMARDLLSPARSGVS